MSSQAPVYEYTSAIMRRPARSVVDGLRAGDHDGPSYEGVKSEHEAYIAAMKAAGVDVSVLPALEAYPDSIFVEDPALVFPEGAILLHPGAESRVGEVVEISAVLRGQFENVLSLPEPGFVEGGDVLVTKDSVMIGLSSRTDRAGAKGLCACLEKFGRKGVIVETPEDVLHFKTDCSLLDEETVLTTKRLERSGVFDGLKTVITSDGEEAAANALRVNDVVMVGSDFPQTIDLLEGRGYKTVPLKTTEIGKIDAGLSCMSLRWRRP